MAFLFEAGIDSSRPHSVLLGAGQRTSAHAQLTIASPAVSLRPGTPTLNVVTATDSCQPKGLCYAHAVALEARLRHVARARHPTMPLGNELSRPRDSPQKTLLSQSPAGTPGHPWAVWLYGTASPLSDIVSLPAFRICPSICPAVPYSRSCKLKHIDPQTNARSETNLQQLVASKNRSTGWRSIR